VQARTARQARNEALHREVNERLAEMDKQSHGWANDDELFDFLCECAAGNGCDARVRMRLGEYERIRQQDDRFAVAPGHEDPDIEQVVHANDRYVVVDKAAELEPFVEDDPRGAPSS
jgi:hypothetical protein